MLSKELRLKKSSSFKATYLNRKVVSDEFFILYGGRQKNIETIPTKIGFVVSKKIHKRAVKRNKIKRRLRESVRILLKDNEFKNWDKFQSLIFSAKQEALNADFSAVKNSVTKLMDKLANNFI